MDWVDDNIKEYISMIDEILNKKTYKLGDLTSHDFPAIYLIINPNTNNVVYVGETEKGLTSRLAQHISSRQPNSLYQKIQGFSSYPKTIENYDVLYMKITDDKERRYFEKFAISVLKPSLNY